MVNACAVGHGRRGWVRVCVDDFVAALLAFADDGGYAAEYAFSFEGAGLGICPVKDFGAYVEAEFFGR